MENVREINCHSEKTVSPSENSFIINWEIENSNYYIQAGYKLHSPVFIVDVMERTGWRIALCRARPSKDIYATLKREKQDDGPEKFDLHYNIEIIYTKEKVSKNESRSYDFEKDETGSPILLNDWEKFWSHDKITVRCIMKKNDGPISKPGQCIAWTQLKGESFQFIGKVKNYSTLTPGEKRTLSVLSSSEGEQLMSVGFRLTNSPLKSIVLDIVPTVEKKEYSYFFASAVLDWLGKKTNIQEKYRYTLQGKVSLENYSRNAIEDCTDFYLPNDTLSVLCEITVITGIKSEKIEKISYNEPFVEEMNENVSPSSNLETSSTAEVLPISFNSNSKSGDPSQNTPFEASKQEESQTNLFPSALEDITSFYKKGILCDAKLQTATETLSAHKAILSARSPVFEAMFTSDMKEKIQECVHIDDLDAETVKRMLLFFYSDTLEELDWSDAKKLFFAADKYQVLSLKHRCTKILKKNIDMKNFCELLVLSDIHQDHDLKAHVQRFIAIYDKNVFLSTQWRNLEKSYPHLAIDILRAIHIKSS